MTHPSQIGLARARYRVRVHDQESGLPVAGALVALSKGTEDYAYGRTNEDGVIVFDFRPESVGDVAVPGGRDRELGMGVEVRPELHL